MQTKVVKIDPFQIDENEMKEAAELGSLTVEYLKKLSQVA